MIKTGKIAIVVCLSLLSALAQSKSPARKAPASSGVMAVTATGPEARKLFEAGMVLAENLRNSEAAAKFAAAAKADPNFALAHAFYSISTRDPKLEMAEAVRAKTLAASVTKGEQLMIQWIAGQKEGDFVRAISAMNDFKSGFPRDKRARFFFGKWLLGQQNNEAAIAVLNEALAIDKDYPAALNEIGYAYSGLGQHAKGIAALERYVQVLPNEPNPQDSLAELHRIAGHFDKALEHYRAALKILPSFTSSQLGLGDTYALMGDQKRAREEYAKAIAAEGDSRDGFDYRYQNAISYLREKDFPGADKALRELAQQADKAGFSDMESQCHRTLAVISEDRSAALKHLDEAQASLSHGHGLSQTARDQEMARILRARVMLAAAAGNHDLSVATLKQLAKMAETSRDMQVQRAYHAANGGIMWMDKKYTEAAPELAEDPDDALSMQRLAEAYEKSGNADGKAVRDRLANTHRPLLEDALIKLRTP